MKYSSPTEHAPLGLINNVAIDLIIYAIIALPILYLLIRYIIVPLVVFLVKLIFEAFKVVIGIVIIVGVIAFVGELVTSPTPEKCKTSNMSDKGICYGIHTWDNGDKYDGEWKDGKKSGQGTYTFANGSKYVGEWRNNDFHGQGTHTWVNGDKYDGEWKDGKKSGQGTYTFANGDKKVGEFKDNFFIKHNEIKKTQTQETDSFSDFFNFVENKWNERKKRKQLEKWVKNNRSYNSNKKSYNAEESPFEIDVHTTYGNKIIECPQGRSAECFDDSGRLYEFMDDDVLADIESGDLMIVED